jgi:hypothetical protein
MTAFTLGEASVRVLARAEGGLRDRSRASARTRTPHRTGHRTGAPVLRDSIEAGTFEELFFATPAPGETDRLLRACRRTLDAGRRLRREERAGTRTLSATERSIAGLTAAAVRVFEELCTLARLNQGRVYPSYDWLAEATALGRATVARALHALERCGFLVRQRRFKRVDGEGPCYRQTSNAYRPLLPICRAGCAPHRCRSIRNSIAPSRRRRMRRCSRACRVGNWLRRASAGCSARCSRRSVPRSTSTSPSPASLKTIRNPKWIFIEEVVLELA